MVRKILAKFSARFATTGAVSFEEARIELFYLILGANVVKGLLYLFDAFNSHQGAGERFV